MTDPTDALEQAMHTFLDTVRTDGVAPLPCIRELFVAAFDVMEAKSTDDIFSEPLVATIGFLGYEMHRRFNELSSFTVALVAQCGGTATVARSEMKKAESGYFVHIGKSDAEMTFSVADRPSLN